MLLTHCFSGYYHVIMEIGKINMCYQAKDLKMCEIFLNLMA